MMPGGIASAQEFQLPDPKQVLEEADNGSDSTAPEITESGAAPVELKDSKWKEYSPEERRYILSALEYLKSHDMPSEMDSPNGISLKYFYCSLYNKYANIAFVQKRNGILVEDADIELRVDGAKVSVWKSMALDDKLEPGAPSKAKVTPDSIRANWKDQAGVYENLVHEYKKEVAITKDALSASPENPAELVYVTKINDKTLPKLKLAWKIPATTSDPKLRWTVVADALSGAALEIRQESSKYP